VNGRVGGAIHAARRRWDSGGRPGRPGNSRTWHQPPRKIKRPPPQRSGWRTKGTSSALAYSPAAPNPRAIPHNPPKLDNTTASTRNCIRTPTTAIPELVKQVQAALFSHIGTAPQDDDITLLAIQRLAAKACLDFHRGRNRSRYRNRKRKTIQTIDALVKSTELRYVGEGRSL
jgi:hypothetical protein